MSTEGEARRLRARISEAAGDLDAKGLARVDDGAAALWYLRPNGVSAAGGRVYLGTRAEAGSEFVPVDVLDGPLAFAGAARLPKVARLIRGRWTASRSARASPCEPGRLPSTMRLNVDFLRATSGNPLDPGGLSRTGTLTSGRYAGAMTMYRGTGAGANSWTADTAIGGTNGPNARQFFETSAVASPNAPPIPGFYVDTYTSFFGVLRQAAIPYGPTYLGESLYVYYSHTFGLECRDGRLEFTHFLHDIEGYVDYQSGGIDGTNNYERRSYVSLGYYYTRPATVESYSPLLITVGAIDKIVTLDARRVRSGSLIYYVGESHEYQPPMSPRMLGFVEDPLQPPPGTDYYAPPGSAGLSPVHAWEIPGAPFGIYSLSVTEGVGV